MEHIHAHRLAVFFGMMATGVSRSFEPDAMMQAERYYVLACAALALTPLIAEAMAATIQGLFLINAFLCTTTRVSSEESWLLIGLCGRLAFRVRTSCAMPTDDAILIAHSSYADRASLSAASHFPGRDADLSI